MPVKQSNNEYAVVVLCAPNHILSMVKHNFEIVITSLAITYLHNFTRNRFCKKRKLTRLKGMYCPNYADC